jgi:type VI protein secretion system component Hcp
LIVSEGTAFLKLSNDVIGDSTDPRHAGWIEIFSYSIGSAGRPVGANSAQTPPSGELIITKKNDRASGHLMGAIAKSTSFAWAILDVPKSQIYFTMNDVMLTTMNFSTNREENYEQLGIAFGGIAFNSGAAPNQLLAVKDVAAGVAQMALSMLRKIASK